MDQYHERGAIKHLSTRREISHEEFVAEGKERFGDNPDEWPFKCPRCGHVQTIQGLMDRHDLTRNEAVRKVNFSCEGRMPGSKVGCDWTLGGLLQIHTLEVIDGDDRIISFDFPDGGYERVALEATEGEPQNDRVELEATDIEPENDEVTVTGWAAFLDDEEAP